ncbi:MAG TPA: FAD-binding oxidoreductase [Candidatus Saccharimonadales bacterium]|nr:FAD-binding oxidoreductase [Candidatus Saccharimonadales bacterium]
MSKIGQYLQQHLSGEVVTSVDARRYFSTDASIFSVVPSAVVYPRNENDVRKATRFTWQLAERGRIVPITARGSGTDQAGAALGAGLMMVFPAHMNRIVEFDGKSGVVTVEPGINYGKLQQTLQTHGRFLPPFPASLEYSTVGGAVANNASGELSFKYGDTREFVRSLRVVLANGEVIETSRIGKKELSKKLGLSTFEGEIYRAIDALLEEHQELVDLTALNVTKNTAGYSLLDIKHRDGSFDLTPLFVGSQGTLGVITEITLDTEAHNPETSLILATFGSMEDAQAAVLDLRKMKELPAAIEMVDGHMLAIAETLNPHLLKDVIEKPLPKAVLLVAFDNPERTQKKLVKQATKILQKYAAGQRLETELEGQEILAKVRNASAMVAAHANGNAKAVPVIEDGIVPVENLAEFTAKIYDLFAKAHVKPAVWGHAGDANLHMQPYLDLGTVGDRQKAFRLMDEYYKLVVSMGGSTSGEMGDGRLRAPFLPNVYGDQVYALFQKIKMVFDPYGTLNPGVKVNATLNDIKPLMRSEYSLNHLYDHLPRL